MIHPDCPGLPFKNKRSRVAIELTFHQPDSLVGPLLCSHQCANRVPQSGIGIRCHSLHIRTAEGLPDLIDLLVTKD